MGQGNISVNQAKQYGDQKALDNVAKATQQTPMTDVPIPVREAGRPSGGQTLGQAPPAEVPAEHQDLALKMARMDWARGVWRNIAAQMPTQDVQDMLRDADDTFNQLAARFYRESPNIE